MKKISDNIPNAITLLNLTSGAISVIYALTGNLLIASWMILLAAFFDFLDGFTARLLHAKSPIGAQLDSLADVVSFGLAPAMILFGLLQENPGLTQLESGARFLLPYASLIILLGSAYRLARFNNDPGQEFSFAGLPTPATGLFMATLPMIQRQFSGQETLDSFIANPFVLLTVIVLFSWLMVSRLPMIAIKFRSYAWKENKTRYFLLIISPFLLVFFKSFGLALIIVLYILLSMLDWAIAPRNE